MTRIAIIPTLTDGRNGLWSVSRSEGRIPMNWGALLAANGYDVVVASKDPPVEHIPSVPNVTYLSPDDVGEVDFVLWGSTSRLSSNWYGRGTIKAKSVIRLQWPAGGFIDTSGDVVAIPHPCVAKTVALETGIPSDRLPVLPSPALPLSWWRKVCDIPEVECGVRPYVLWAARDAFGDKNGGSYVYYGESALKTLERNIQKYGLIPCVISKEQYQQEYGPYVQKYQPLNRFNNLGAKLTSMIPLGHVLELMRQSVLAVTLPPIMGPTLMEAIFEGCAPLVWNYYRCLFPELCAAAEKHGLLLKSEDQIERTIVRLLDDSNLRNLYIDSCKFAFSEHSPAKAMEAWRKLESRC